MTRLSIWPLSIFLVLALPAAAAHRPTPSGYVTDKGSPADFKLDGVTVRCTSNTVQKIEEKGATSYLHTCAVRFVGEALIVYGKKDQSGSITATEIDPVPPEEREIAGFGVIDAVRSSPGSATPVLVSADGYTIRIPPTVHIGFEAPLTAKDGVTTNEWLRYTATLQPDGSALAKTAIVSANVLKDREHRANEKAEFDPAVVTETDKQGKVNTFFKGVDPKRFPATHDAAMQSRIEAIGATLIPDYQRNLPANDPSKINFRFQVVDQPKLHDATTLSNGIILVPQQVLTRLENDSQVATVLADNIACALEKQTLRLIPVGRTLTAGQIAAAAGGIFVPGLGLAASAAGVATSEVAERRSEEQSGRVSLVLLHHAGYDLTQAPMTWWILSPKKNKPLTSYPMPFRASYLYQVLGEVWHPGSPESLTVPMSAP